MFVIIIYCNELSNRIGHKVFWGNPRLVKLINVLTRALWFRQFFVLTWYFFLWCQKNLWRYLSDYLTHFENLTDNPAFVREKKPRCSVCLLNIKERYAGIWKLRTVSHLYWCMNYAGHRRDRRSRDSMVVGFITTYAISAYHY
jgi:hypothetical protein